MSAAHTQEFLFGKGLTSRLSKSFFSIRFLGFNARDYNLCQVRHMMNSASQSKPLQSYNFRSSGVRRTVRLFQVEKEFVSDSNAELSMYLHKENALEIIFR